MFWSQCPPVKSEHFNLSQWLKFPCSKKADRKSLCVCYSSCFSRKHRHLLLFISDSWKVFFILQSARRSWFPCSVIEAVRRYDLLRNPHHIIQLPQTHTPTKSTPAWTGYYALAPDQLHACANNYYSYGRHGLKTAKGKTFSIDKTQRIPAHHWSFPHKEVLHVLDHICLPLQLIILHLSTKNSW